MMRNTRFLAVACIGLGMLLGYAAASGRLNPWQRAQAGPPAPSAVADRSSPSAKQEPGCCDGLAKGELVALADPKVKETLARAEANGKKPNILFIMGDDIGWFQIGAYHRGMMSGKTPNLDKLASQGMLFTDYYAEASCTPGRAHLIPREIPERTRCPTLGRAGPDLALRGQD